MLLIVRQHTRMHVHMHAGTRFPSGTAAVLIRTPDPRRGEKVLAGCRMGRRSFDAVTLRLPIRSLPDDALGVCARPRSEGGGVDVVIPPRSGCVF